MSGRGDFGNSGRGCFVHDSGNAVDFDCCVADFGYIERTADGDYNGLGNAVVDWGLDGTSVAETQALEYTPTSCPRPIGERSAHKTTEVSVILKYILGLSL
jgi:hypothetical protein